MSIDSNIFIYIYAVNKFLCSSCRCCVSCYCWCYIRHRTCAKWMDKNVKIMVINENITFYVYMWEYKHSAHTHTLIQSNILNVLYAIASRWIKYAPYCLSFRRYQLSISCFLLSYSQFTLIGHLKMLCNRTTGVGLRFFLMWNAFKMTYHSVILNVS